MALRALPLPRLGRRAVDDGQPRDARGPTGGDSDEGRPPWPVWIRVATRVAVAIYAALIALRFERNVLLDDAAITFRYVERLTSGLGFSYNDHEQVLGASNPLYTLLLAALDLLGAQPNTGARLVAFVAMVVTALLAADIAERLSNPIAGLIAGVAVVTEPHFRLMALSGMESGFATALGLGAIALLIRRHEVLAGIVLGLAIWNKLDAGLLAVAIAGAVVLAERRFPFKTAVAAAITVAPWAIFATAYFGSPLPNSFVTKTQHEEMGFTQDYDHLWVVKLLGENYRWALVLLAAAALPLLARRPRPVRVGGYALCGWFVLHGLAFSLINLGEEFPWYLTVLIPPIVILAAVCVAELARRLPRPWGQLAAAGAAVVLVLAMSPGLWQVARAVERPPKLDPFEAFDADRHMAGLFVDRYSDPREVVASYFGWTAFGALDNPFNDRVFLNSRRLLEPEAYHIGHGDPYDRGYRAPEGPPGYIELANFTLASDVKPGYSWFTVFGRPDSAIARSGRRYLQRRLFQLPPPQPVSHALTPKGIRVEGNNLIGRTSYGARFAVENRRQPVFVVFSTAARAPRRSTAPSVPFELRDGERVAYRTEVVPRKRTRQSEGSRAGICGQAKRGRPQIGLIPGSTKRDQVDLAFVARGGGPARAAWCGVKVVIGEFPLRLQDLGSRAVVRRVVRFSPVPGRVGPSAPERH